MSTGSAASVRAMFVAGLLFACAGEDVSLPEKQFLSSDWQTVYQAEFQIESAGAAALPRLIAMLDRQEVVKLTDTADLIYPGAETFWGHGWLILYDLDHLASRAGWALEELTFENFGFGEGVGQPTKNREANREKAIARAKAWYAENRRGWSRYEALQAALASGDSFRQLKALQWLRYGITRCEGLTVQRYETEVRPLVSRLALMGEPGVKLQASHLLSDDENYWWRYKTDPELRKWADPTAK